MTHTNELQTLKQLTPRCKRGEDKDLLSKGILSKKDINIIKTTHIVYTK